MRADLIAACIGAALFLLPHVGHAQLVQVDEAAVGRIEFIFTGGSFLDNVGVDNGANCLNTSARAIVRADELPPRPTLVRAILTVSGSLFGNDGLDFQNPDTDLLDATDLSWDDLNDRAEILRRAEQAADREVNFLPPGANEPFRLEALAEDVSFDGYIRLPDLRVATGNVVFFQVRYDVTEALALTNSLAGEYVVSELLSDVCFGLEAMCSDGQRCDQTSETHPNAVAAFSLLLIVEAPSLPVRTVAAFEGLDLFFATTRSITLDTPRPFSDPAAGRLAFYSLEGDITIAEPDEDRLCGGIESIAVDGDTDPETPGICLNDDDNPVGNVFNSTINVQDSDPELSVACEGPDDIACCRGEALCGVNGVDIDRFDISEALEPGTDEIRVALETGTDLIALSSIVLEADLFEAILNVDSQIRVLDANTNDQIQLGAPLTYVVVVSNTGNVDARGVNIQLSAPPQTSGLEILAIPEGARDESDPDIGDNRTGLVDVRDFVVPPGEIRDVVFRVTPDCDTLDLPIESEVIIGRDGGPTFARSAPSVTPVGPGVAVCEGIDPNGPFFDDSDIARRVLRSGGGCQSGAALPSVALTLIFGLMAIRLRRRPTR